jgi:sugar lactone lactonase YvrE
VAIKVLTAAVATNSTAVADFKAEARLLSKLDHPHIVRTHDYVGRGELCLLVMEMLSGGTLAGRRLSPEGACAVGLAVADALSHAHSAGVLHRDVKPGNILFTTAGQPKITDFGIAKIFEGTASTASRIVGTPKYMAPEQITGDRLGPATDIYALGVVLYELLAGRPPFGPNLSVPELVRHHCDVMPPPPEGVPGPVAEVVMRALAKKPADRYPSAHAFALDLSHAATRAFGRHWIARSGIVLHVADELRNPARRNRLRRSGRAPGARPDTGETRRLGVRKRLWIPVGVLIAATVAGAAALVIPDRSPPPPPQPPPAPAWQPSALQKPGTITIVAGTGDEGFSGDNGPALQAEFASPKGMRMDTRGDLYIADSDNQRIRRVDANGVITTVAGSGIAGYSGDNGPATQAELHDPSDMVVDGAGNLYIADAGNHRVRRVDTRGIITTVAGTGQQGFSGYSEAGGGVFSGDNVPAIQAQFDYPDSVTLDGAGNLYIADGDNNRIRRVDPAGIITTIAGTGAKGFAGDNGPAIGARLSFPSNLEVDGAGNLYFSDTFNYRVRRIGPKGVITTVAGTGGQGFAGDDGPATRAQLSNVGGVAVDAAGNLYIADSSNGRVRRIDTNGIITTVAGTGVLGDAGNNRPATEAGLHYPGGVTVDGAGNLYIVDQNGNRIRVVRRSEPR